MKKFLAVVLGVIFVLSLVSLAFAEMKKGTIKSVNQKEGTVTFCPEGTSENQTLKVDKSVDLKNVKADSKVEVNLDNNTVKEIKAAPQKRIIEGC